MKSWIVRVQPKHIMAISDVLQLLHSEGYSGELYNSLSDTLEDLKFKGENMNEDKPKFDNKVTCSKCNQEAVALNLHDKIDYTAQSTTVLWCVNGHVVIVDTANPFMYPYKVVYTFGMHNNVDNALNEANALHTGDKEPTLSPEDDLEQARRTR